MNQKRAELKELMESILQEDYITFSLSSCQIEERVEEKRSGILAKLFFSDRSDAIVIEGEGVGALDAFFLAMRNRLSEECPSVKAIIFSAIEAKSVPNSDQEHPTDAEGEVTLYVRNSYGDEIEFFCRSRSLLHASLEAIMKAFEYFVNSEKAYIRAYQALEHHRHQYRPELEDRYTSYLSLLVRNTSYEEVIEQLNESK